MKISLFVNPLPRSQLRWLSLGAQATPSAARVLLSLGALAGRDWWRAMAVCRTALVWRDWFRMFCLWAVVGSACVAAAAALMSLIIVGGGTGLVVAVDAAAVAAAAGAWLVGLNSPVGKFLLFVVLMMGWAAILMVDRIYPVMGGAWETTATASLLAFLVMVAGGSAFLALAWLGITNLALLQFGFEVVMPEGYLSWTAFAVSLSLANLALLAARERLAAARIGAGWLDRPYLGIALLCAAFGYASIPAVAFFARINTLSTAMGAGVLALVALGVLSYYGLLRKYIPAVLAVLFWAAFLLVFFLYRAVVVESGEHNFAASLAAFIAAVAVLNAGVLYAISRWDSGGGGAS